MQGAAGNGNGQVAGRLAGCRSAGNQLGLALGFLDE
jgi:hypothetical protein